MKLQQLKLNTFKNHSSRQFDFTEDVVVLHGPNGVGKTNVLDAIYLLCMCRSYFQNTELSNIQHGADFYSVYSKIFFDEQAEVACMVKKGEGKTFRFNKEDYNRLSDHIGKMPVVMIAPGDIRLINEYSDERRKFVDILLSQTDSEYLQNLMRYQRALDQRNKQLKTIQESGFVDHTLLDSLDFQLAQTGEYLFQQRKNFIEKFTPYFTHHHQTLGKQNEEAGLHYKSDCLEKDMKSLLKEGRSRDLDLARTDRGLHKDDIEFQLDAYPLKKFGSQGQIKTFLIALKLAQFDYLKEMKGTHPFLLLDDIFEKLDEQRASRLMELVAEGHFGQIFITDTHPDRVLSIFEKMGKLPQMIAI